LQDIDLHTVLLFLGAIGTSAADILQEHMFVLYAPYSLPGDVSFHCLTISLFQDGGDDEDEAPPPPPPTDDQLFAPGAGAGPGPMAAADDSNR
jgi:hypothetical protein